MKPGRAGEESGVGGVFAPGRVWLLACLLFAAGAWLASPAGPLGPAGVELLGWFPDRWRAQPWRWWGAALVHGDGQQLALGLAGLAVLAGLGLRARLPAAAVLAWLAAWPLLHLALQLPARWWPQLSHYAGLGGVLHAGVAVLATWATASGVARQRLLGWLLLWALALKLMLESHGHLAAWAHLFGALFGVVCAALALAQRPGSGG